MVAARTRPPEEPPISHDIWTPEGLDVARATSVAAAALVAGPITALFDPPVTCIATPKMRDVDGGRIARIYGRFGFGADRGWPVSRIRMYPFGSRA